MKTHILQSFAFLILAGCVHAEPSISAMVPAAAQRGTTATLEVWGGGLEHVRSVWVENTDLDFRIVQDVPETDAKEPESGQDVQQDAQSDAAPDGDTEPEGNEETTDQKKTEKPKPPLKIEVGIPADCDPKTCGIRLVSHAGVSASTEFRVTGEPCVIETDAPHTMIADAQLLAIPSIVQGTVRQEGERDLYAIDVEAGQEVLIEGLTIGQTATGFSIGGPFRMVFALYRQSDSWFEEKRLVRLGEGNSPPRLRYRFEESGRYYIAAWGFLGLGGGDKNYMLRITDQPDAPGAFIPEYLTWGGEFQRNLPASRLRDLWKGTVHVAAPSPAEDEKEADEKEMKEPRKGWENPTDEDVSVLVESSPDTGTLVASVQIPSLMQGTIGSPGDVDEYAFSAKKGDRIAIEIQAPRARPVQFNPYVRVLADDDSEVCSNLYNKVEGDGDDWVRYVKDRIIYTFRLGGQYRLQVRDITFREGGDDFVYHVLLRPQVPHISSIAVEGDRLNLHRGRATKIKMTVYQEEGFEGDVAFIVENLPEGVIALPAADVKPDKGEPFPSIHPEWYEGKNREVTLQLLVAPDAPPTDRPRMIEIKARQISQGKPGEPYSIRKILTMVTGPSPAKPDPVVADASDGNE
jgi:hypothetical protein